MVDAAARALLLVKNWMGLPGVWEIQEFGQLDGIRHGTEEGGIRDVEICNR